jgi:glucoamylase
MQLDEAASLVLLASRLREAKALERFNPWKVVKKAAAYLIKAGPVTPQERWEENAGYSPSTLAGVIAGITASADFAQDERETTARDFLLSYADWLNAHVEDWTVTQEGTVYNKVKEHYLRVTPADPNASELCPDPDHAEIQLANGGGRHPAKEIVSGDFLELVRLGVRSADDPIIRNSVKVIDHVLRRKMPYGYGWRRYNHDGYGQKKNGQPFDGTGTGRCWPLLAGERGHYAIAREQDARPYLRMMEKSADRGYLLPEQIWDEAPSRDHSYRLGAPSGSAMPLCWSHAEYLSLVRSQRDQRVFDRIESVYRRYAKVKNNSDYHYEFWSLRYRRSTIEGGKQLRIIGDGEGHVIWSMNPLAKQGEVTFKESGLERLWFADLPISAVPSGGVIEFRLEGVLGWEGITFKLTVA